MKRRYAGSCHCGTVRFQCELDLSAETSRCNCSVCRKARLWKAIATEDAVTVLQGEDRLTEYRFGSRTIRHFFCSLCGIKPFGRGDIEGLGPFYAINLACLDDAADAELAAAPVKFEDGRNNDWGHAPAETRHL